MGRLFRGQLFAMSLNELRFDNLFATSLSRALQVKAIGGHSSEGPSPPRFPNVGRPRLLPLFPRHLGDNRKRSGSWARAYWSVAPAALFLDASLSFECA